MFAATADAAGGEAGAISDCEPDAIQGRRAGGQGAVGPIQSQGIAPRPHSHFVCRQLGIHGNGDVPAVIDGSSQVVRLVGMTALNIMCLDGYRIPQSLVHHFVACGAAGISGIRGKVQPFGNIGFIGGNVTPVGIHHRSHALQLVFRSGPAADGFGGSYGPCLIVQTGNVISGFRGVTAVSLAAHDHGPGGNGIESRQVFGQLELQGPVTGGDADVVPRSQIGRRCFPAGNTQGAVQFYRSGTRIPSQFQPVIQCGYVMSGSAVPIDILEPVDIGAVDVCRPIAHPQRGSFIFGTVSAGAHNLYKACISLYGIRRSLTSCDAVHADVLVQSDVQFGRDGLPVISRFIDPGDQNVFPGIFRSRLGARALDLKGASLIHMNSGIRIVSLEVQSLAFHCFQLSHVHGIRIVGAGGQVGNLPGNRNGFALFIGGFPSQGHGAAGGNPGRGRIGGFRQVTLDSFRRICHGMSPQGHASFYAGEGSNAKSRTFIGRCLGMVAIGRTARLRSRSLKTYSYSSPVGRRIGIRIGCPRIGKYAKSNREIPCSFIFCTYGNGLCS